MTERPILFSGPMVRAILEGRKTQTRRIVGVNNGTVLRIGGCRLNPNALAFTQSRQQGSFWYIHEKLGNPTSGLFAEIKCPYGQPGDRLWVRETWRQAYPVAPYSDGIVYRADKSRALGMDEYSDRHKWKPSIHMPRKYCRLVLEVKAVRVERLQDISEEDAKAEGATISASLAAKGINSRSRFQKKRHIRAFERLWDSINANRAPWESNPWVWVVEFERATADAGLKT